MFRYFCRIVAGTRHPNSMAIVGRGSLVGALGGLFTAGIGFRAKGFIDDFDCIDVFGCPVSGDELTAGLELVAGATFALPVSKPMTLGTCAIRFFSPPDDVGNGAAVVRLREDDDCGQGCVPAAALASCSFLYRSIIIIPGVRRCICGF